MKKMHLLSSVVVLSGGLLAAEPAMAASLVADYNFENSLSDSLGGPIASYPQNSWYADSSIHPAPYLNYVNETTLRGTTETALKFECINDEDGRLRRGAGVTVDVSSTVTPAHYQDYSVAMLVKFTSFVAGYQRLYWSSDVDNGLYLMGVSATDTDTTGVNFYIGGGNYQAPQFTTSDGYIQLVLTRSGGVVSLYKGVGAGSASVVASIATGDTSYDISATGLLNLFNDGPSFPDKGLSGNLARLQVFQGALSPGDVTNLNLVAPVPEPGMLASASIGICLMFRRRRSSADV